MIKAVKAKKSESHITAKRVDGGVTVDIDCNGEELIALFCSIVNAVKEETDSGTVMLMVSAALATDIPHTSTDSAVET